MATVVARYPQNLKAQDPLGVYIPRICGGNPYMGLDLGIATSFMPGAAAARTDNYNPSLYCYTENILSEQKVDFINNV